MSKNSKAGQRASRQQKPTKIIVKRQYVGTEKMETIFSRIAGADNKKGSTYDTKQCGLEVEMEKAILYNRS